MTATAPNAIETDQVRITIKVRGEVINSDVAVLSIVTTSKINQIPNARIEISDGDAVTSSFPISDSNTFVPGAQIDITAGYLDGREASIFSGQITKTGLSITEKDDPTLIVDATDKAMAMTLGRNNGVYTKTTDSDLIGMLIDRNGLTKKVEETTTTFDEVVQYYATDWDMMLTRAEMNAMVVNVKAGTVTVGVPDTTQAPDLAVTYGDSLFDLHIEMDAASQFSSSAISSRSWDSETQQVIASGPRNPRFNEPGNLSSSKLAKVFGIKNVTQQTGAPLELSSLENWSTAKALRSKLSKIRGTVSFQGSAVAQTGAMIELAGLGARFNGSTYISGVQHTISQGRWITEVTLGLTAKTFAEITPDIAAPAASGLLPGVSGLQTGIVRNVTKDPENGTRVEITLPLLGDDARTVCARLSTLYASTRVEDVSHPETGDEVIVGFMNDDPRYPVILGCVVSK